MSRTEDLARSGATSIGGGGGGASFVKWDDEYAWVEGRVREIWESQYGKVALLEVTAASDTLRVTDKDDEGNKTSVGVVAGDDLNVSLNYAGLKGINAGHITATIHIAFEGWGETKAGQRFRAFRVLEINAADEADTPITPSYEKVAFGGSQPESDNLPF